MEYYTPRVTLLSWSQHPLETVYSIWQASKSEEPLVHPVGVAVRRMDDPEFDQEVRELFRAVIAQRIPVGESIDFVFMIEDVSVSWREQAVRHRIGVKPSPERLGSDIVVGEIPNLADSAWWSQSMRIQNMGKFADRRAYRVPQAILDHPESDRLLEMFNGTMSGVQDTYNELVKAGIPMEDARELIPLGAQHRLSWKLNIGSLQHIVGKRGCWILQLGIWGPVIKGMIQELVDKVDPIFGELVTPPCLKGDKFTGCIYHEENRRRYTGDDKHPACPLHFRYHRIAERMGTSDDIAGAHAPSIHTKFKLPMAVEMRERAKEYELFWNRDPYTGKRLEG
jgi:thymidylate synthase (FAD)